MNVLLFGATGMVGSGVLDECLADPAVTAILSVGRRPSGRTHPRLIEHIRSDFFDYSDAVDRLAAHDACFFCLGVSSVGMNEAEYRRLTFDLTLAAAESLAERNPGMTFCYLSAEGTDSTGEGRIMWARVRGRTENALLALPLDAYMFRPGYLQPLKGVRSRHRSYRIAHAALGPVFPLLSRLFPAHVSTTENMGRAMIRVAAEGYPERVLENPDINALAATPPRQGEGA